ncbi:MAG: transcription elongation factor GreA [Chloroflexi bacterium]|nr:transcription elongation factor GreA [Chloroflexota bacterium]MCZ6707399.1 transcription elongation factor GreA [Chloroflexota bacterium]
MAPSVSTSQGDVEELEIIEGPEGDESEDGGDVLTLERAVSAYLGVAGDKLEQHERVALTRFVSWYGPTREIVEISAHEMTLFQDAVGNNAANLADRLLPVKAFFAHAKKRSWTGTNLGVHLRVKKSALKLKSKSKAVVDEEIVEMTEEGLRVAKEDLERLRSERPNIQADLAAAMADKDFRENAPLDAARDAQAMLEARIRDLDHQIGHSVVVERHTAADSDRVHLGSTVRLMNLETDGPVEYTLVSQNEVDAAAGRISAASPVGEALVGRAVGDEVQVVVPAGSLQFRVESIEG